MEEVIQDPPPMLFGVPLRPLDMGEEDRLLTWLTRLLLFLSLVTPSGRACWGFVLYWWWVSHAMLIGYLYRFWPLTLLCAVGILRIWRRRLHIRKAVAPILLAVDGTHIQARDDATLFQREVLAEFRAKRGVPILNRANLLTVRLQIHEIVAKRKEHMRKCDLEMHVTRVTCLAFIPGKDDVEYSKLLIPQQSWLSRVMDWIVGADIIRRRIQELRRPVD